MSRSVLIHGKDADVVRKVASEVASQLGIPWIDRLGVGSDKVVELDERDQSTCVLSVRSEVLLDRTRRVEALAKWTVVALGGSGSWIPSVGGEARSGVAGLGPILGREFQEAHVFSDELPKDTGAVVRRIVEVSRHQSIAVAGGRETYLVEVGQGNVERGLVGLGSGSPVMLYLTDENVERLHGAMLGRASGATGMRVTKHVLIPGEEQKRLETLGTIFDRALEAGVDRSSWLVAAGGGVTTDIGGLVAALWMRGVRWVGIPTTLLAMVDASVGGKTAVDHGMGKNAVGAFWQPSRVICDVEFLRTEAERNYRGGLAEAVKTAVVGDVGLFGTLRERREAVARRDLDVMEEVVRRCVQVKARIVGLDARESGLRAVLNLGHTIGHALEALGEYRRYTHGEAVSVGLVAGMRVAVKLGSTPRDLAEEVEAMLASFGLPTEVDRTELSAASELLGHDKKRAGSAIRFVVAKGIGDVTVERIGLEDLRDLVKGD